MILITKFTVIIIALIILLLGLSNRRTHTAKAWKKIGLLLLVVAMIVAVLFPNTTNELAHLVGIGRGADLLLYGLSLAFIAYALNSYLQQQSEKDALYRLARKVALLEATNRYKTDKK